MAAPSPDPAPPLLALEGLEVRLPDGRAVLVDAGLTVRPGEVVALLGASGAGKSTLVRALFETEGLRRAGFQVGWGRREMGPAALVPQLGAPLDYLDVPGNVRLAQRWQGGKPAEGPAAWLAAVGLPEAVTRPGTPTSGLSGGQRQRLAVARALAAGRALLFLDEPSAGLDPLGVHELATLLRAQARERGAGMVLVTHDTLLASEAADRCVILEGGRLAPIEGVAGRREALEALLRERLAHPVAAPGERRPAPRLPRLLEQGWTRTLGAAEVPPLALAQLARVRPRHLPALLQVVGRVLRQALLRPAPFYALVSTLLGFTILYVLARSAPSGMGPAPLLDLVGGSYVLALAPAFAALLFVATSGSAVSAWLGSLSLGRQLSALEALGIRQETYLWLPVFLTLTGAFLATAALVAAGLVAGGALVHLVEGVGPQVGGIFGNLTGDLFDPVPERADLRARAVWLAALYAPGIAADVVRRGLTPKQQSEDVTRAMTGSVIAATVWVVVLELASALVLLSGGTP